MGVIEKLGSDSPHAVGMARGVIVGVSFCATVTLASLTWVGSAFVDQLGKMEKTLSDQTDKLDKLAVAYVSVNERSNAMAASVSEIQNAEKADIDALRQTQDQIKDQAWQEISSLKDRVSRIEGDGAKKR